MKKGFTIISNYDGLALQGILYEPTTPPKGILHIAHGMYEHKEKYLLICVIRSRQIADFEKILKNYPDTFAFASSVSEVFGRFYK